MDTKVSLDEELVARAREATGIEDLNSLVNDALRSIIAEAAGRALIELGGTMPI